MKQICYSWFESPVGDLLLAGSSDGLKLVSFGAGKRARRVDPEWKAGRLVIFRSHGQLQSYFRGRAKKFEIPGAGKQTSRRVLDGHCRKSYGETVSYKELAGKVGNPQSGKAVEQQTERIPSDIIPCHRVIGNDGSLTGSVAGCRLRSVCSSGKPAIETNLKGRGKIRNDAEIVSVATCHAQINSMGGAGCVRGFSRTKSIDKTSYSQRQNSDPGR